MCLTELSIVKIINMAWVAIDEFENECILDPKPSKNKKDKDWKGYWNDFYIGKIRLPKGSIKKLIGRDLTYNDEPVELENE